MVSAIASRTGLTYDQTVVCIRYLLDVQHLWFGGGLLKFEDKEHAHLLPSELILKSKTFADVVARVKQQYAQPMFPPPARSIDGAFTGDGTARGLTTRIDVKRLRPDVVILSFIHELPSDVVVEASNRAGLDVNLETTTQENYSSRTRVRTYLPRIQQAFRKLGDEDRLAAAGSFCKTILVKAPDLRLAIGAALKDISWKLSDGRLLLDDSALREMFFPKGTPHDAYVHCRDLLGKAASRLSIVDPYVDGSLFTMFKGSVQPGVAIQLLTSKVPADFYLEAKKYVEQYPTNHLEVRRTSDFHDRFIFIDGEGCYQIGASLKDAGRTAFMTNLLEDLLNVRAVLGQFDLSWQNAAPYFRLPE
jgi:hypothetical protein